MPSFAALLPSVAVLVVGGAALLIFVDAEQQWLPTMLLVLVAIAIFEVVGRRHGLPRRIRDRGPRSLRPRQWLALLTKAALLGLVLGTLQAVLRPGPAWLAVFVAALWVFLQRSLPPRSPET
jgi:hypothetical protein